MAEAVEVDAKKRKMDSEDPGIEKKKKKKKKGWPN
jgi:hypothetical protein